MEERPLERLLSKQEVASVTTVTNGSNPAVGTNYGQDNRSAISKGSSPFLTTNRRLAQWSERPALKSREVGGSNPSSPANLPVTNNDSCISAHNREQAPNLRQYSSVRQLNGARVKCEANTRKYSVGSHSRAAARGAEGRKVNTSYWHQFGRHHDSIVSQGSSPWTPTNLRVGQWCAVRVGRKDAMEGGDVVEGVYITDMRYPLSNCVEYKTEVRALCYPPISGMRLSERR